MEKSVKRIAVDVRHMLDATQRSSWGTFIVHAHRETRADEYFATYRALLLEELRPLLIDSYSDGVVLSNGRRRMYFDISQEFADERAVRAERPTGITFPAGYEVDGSAWIRFPAIVDGRNVTNRISTDALADYFAATGPFGAAYRSHRRAIQRIARLLIENGRTNYLGGADINTEEVERYGVDANAMADVLPFARPTQR